MSYMTRREQTNQLVKFTLINALILDPQRHRCGAIAIMLTVKCRIEVKCFFLFIHSCVCPVRHWVQRVTEHVSVTIKDTSP